MSEKRLMRGPVDNKKIIIITGGSRGLGRILVQIFLEAGWRVAVLGRQPPAIPIGKDFLFIKADVTQVRMVDSAADRIVKKWGRIDAWINSAGGGEKIPFVGPCQTDWDKIFGLNFLGTVHGCRAAITAMLAGKNRGVVINIASLAGIQACPGHSAYSTAKAAVIALTRSLAVEYADQQIRINAIAPGPLATTGSSGGGSRKRVQTIPTRKLISPFEIAEACLFLARPMDSLTGHVLVIDGGSAATGCYASLK